MSVHAEEAPEQRRGSQAGACGRGAGSPPACSGSPPAASSSLELGQECCFLWCPVDLLCPGTWLLSLASGTLQPDHVSG